MNVIDNCKRAAPQMIEPNLRSRRTVEKTGLNKTARVMIGPTLYMTAGVGHLFFCTEAKMKLLQRFLCSTLPRPGQRGMGSRTLFPARIKNRRWRWGGKSLRRRNMLDGFFLAPIDLFYHLDRKTSCTDGKDLAHDPYYTGGHLRSCGCTAHAKVNVRGKV